MERGADVNLQHKWPTGAVLKSPFVEYFKSRDTYDLNIVKLMLSHGGRVIMKSPLNDSRGQLRNVMRLAVTMTSPQV